MDHSRLFLYYLVRLPVSKASAVTIDLPVPILGHNFLNLIAGYWSEVSRISFMKKKQKNLFIRVTLDEI